MKNFHFGNYKIQITEKSDFDHDSMKHPGLENVIRCKQIHSALIHEYHPDWENEIQGDGMLTDQQNIKLTVGVSDCNAVVIMGKSWFGIVHVGWKELQKGIIPKLFEELKEKGESGFSVFVGPSIRACCYEVGEEFAERCSPEFLRRNPSGKLHFDMLAMITNVLGNEHCKKVVIDPNCTKCSHNFFSYRNGDKVNNVISVIKI